LILLFLHLVSYKNLIRGFLRQEYLQSKVIEAN